MEDCLSRDIKNGEKGEIPVDFDITSASRKLIKAHHPDLGGDEEMMKKVNAAIRRKNIKFIFEESEKLRALELITKEQESALRENEEEIKELFDSPEEIQEILPLLDDGDVGCVVDGIISHLKKNRNIGVRVFNKNFEDTTNKSNLDDKTIRGKKERKSSSKKEEEISSLDDKNNIVFFGKKNKEKNTDNPVIHHRSLKKWNKEDVIKDPSSFVGDVLHNINYQISAKRELRLPKNALNVVFQLIEKEYFKDEYAYLGNRELLLEDVKKNLLSGDIDLVVKELKSIASVFKVNEVFDKYTETNKTEGIDRNKKENKDHAQKNIDNSLMDKSREKDNCTRIIKKMIELSQKMEEIKKEKEKGNDIANRLGIRGNKTFEIDDEYREIREEYNGLRQEFSKISGLNIEEVEEKIFSLKQELREMESRFNKEKAYEYIGHLKKVLEYKKDYVPEEKKVLFEKISSVIHDKRIQVIIGALILGVSIAIPETGGITWLSHKLTSGDLSQELGISLKMAGGVIGGYMEEPIAVKGYQAILRMRKEKFAGIENKIVEKIGKLVYPKGDSVSSTNDLTNRNVIFFDKIQKVEMKNNFIELRKQIIES